MRMTMTCRRWAMFGGRFVWIRHDLGDEMGVQTANKAGRTPNSFCMWRNVPLFEHVWNLMSLMLTTKNIHWFDSPRLGKAKSCSLYLYLTFVHIYSHEMVGFLPKSIRFLEVCDRFDTENPMEWHPYPTVLAAKNLQRQGCFAALKDYELRGRDPTTRMSSWAKWQLWGSVFPTKNGELIEIQLPSGNLT